MTDWASLSEMAFGLLLRGRVSAEAIRPEFFIEPYDSGVKYFKQGNNSIEYMVARLGITPVQAAMDASKEINGTKIDFIQMLERAYLQAQTADTLEIFIRKLRKGEDVNFSSVVEKFNMLEGKQVNGIPMSQIIPEDNPFQDSGWNAIDVHLGGIPKVGLITVGGSPGVGKTSFGIRFIKKYLVQHPDKMALMFTLEMPGAEFKNRALEINNFTKAEQDRLIIFDEIMSVEDIANKAFKYKDEAGLILTDFADLMIQNETSESEMANIYLVQSRLAKRMMCPAMLFSQLNRSYTGGLPRPNHLRYTSLAEALSWDIWMLYNPNTDFHPTSDEGTLPPVDAKGYLLSWKQRGGWRKHGCPGAIQMDWDGKHAWGDDGIWFNLKS